MRPGLVLVGPSPTASARRRVFLPSGSCGLVTRETLDASRSDPRLADERVAVLLCLVADVNSLVVLRLAESAPIVVRRGGSGERDTLHAVGDAAFVRLGDHIAFAGDSPYVYRYDLLRHGEAMPRAAANALLGRHPLEVRELSFTLERANAPLEERPANPSDDPSAPARARIVLTQGWPKLIGREDLCPRAVTLSRRHLVLSFDGRRLLATRIGVNPVRLHRRDARGAPVRVRLERDKTEPVFPGDVVEASPGLCFRVRDERARLAPAPQAALARERDDDSEVEDAAAAVAVVEKRWPSPSPSPSRAPSSSRTRVASGTLPRWGARGRRETRGRRAPGERTSAKKIGDANDEEAKEADDAGADDDADDAGAEFGGSSRAPTPALRLRGEETFAIFVRAMERRVAATTWAREVKRKLLGGFEGDRPPPASDDVDAVDDANRPPPPKPRRMLTRFARRSGSNSTDLAVPLGMAPRERNQRCEFCGGAFEMVAHHYHHCRAKPRSTSPTPPSLPIQSQSPSHLQTFHAATTLVRSFAVAATTSEAVARDDRLGGLAVAAEDAAEDAVEDAVEDSVEDAVEDSVEDSVIVIDEDEDGDEDGEFAAARDDSSVSGSYHTAQ